MFPIDDEKAQEITYDAIRGAGGLNDDDPIANDDKLSELGVIGDAGVDDMETRIIDDLEAERPALELGLDDFKGIDDSSEAGEVVEIVTNARPKQNKHQKPQKQ